MLIHSRGQRRGHPHHTSNLGIDTGQFCPTSPNNTRSMGQQDMPLSQRAPANKRSRASNPRRRLRRGLKRKKGTSCWRLARLGNPNSRATSLVLCLVPRIWMDAAPQVTKIVFRTYNAGRVRPRMTANGVYRHTQKCSSRAILHELPSCVQVPLTGSASLCRSSKP